MVVLRRPVVTKWSWECAWAWPRVPGSRARARRWRAWERSVRSLLIWGAFICLALFYLVRTRGRRGARAGPRALTCHTRRPRAGHAATALQRGPRAAWDAFACCRPRVSIPIAAAARRGRPCVLRRRVARAGRVCSVVVWPASRERTRRAARAR
jgi:hypothetical protein